MDNFVKFPQAVVFEGVKRGPMGGQKPDLDWQLCEHLQGRDSDAETSGRALQKEVAGLCMERTRRKEGVSLQVLMSP